jgi:hypothetical protein
MGLLWKRPVKLVLMLVLMLVLKLVLKLRPQTATFPVVLNPQAALPMSVAIQFLHVP